MAETFLEIPIADFPFKDGTPFLAKIEGVKDGIGKMVIMSPITPQKAPTLGDWAKSMRSKKRDAGISSENKKDLRYIDLLKKHAPWYLEKHAPELLN